MAKCPEFLFLCSLDCSLFVFCFRLQRAAQQTRANGNNVTAVVRFVAAHRELALPEAEGGGHGRSTGEGHRCRGTRATTTKRRQWPEAPFAEEGEEELIGTIINTIGEVTDRHRRRAKTGTGRERRRESQRKRKKRRVRILVSSRLQVSAIVGLGELPGMGRSQCCGGARGLELGEGGSVPPYS